jgi:curved DNA-binding protein
MSYKNYYKILGINKHASTAEVENAYFKLSSRYRSEQFDDELSQQILRDITEAFMVIGDSELRSAYDTKGNDFEIPDRFYDDIREGDPKESKTEILQSNEAIIDLPNAEEIANTFKSLFEKGFKEIVRLSQQDQQRHALDISITVPFSIEEAMTGVIKTIQLQNGGLDVPIPKGAFPGQVLRFVKQGKQSPEGKVIGDLWIRLEEQPHAYLFRKGNDLLYHASVDIYTALLGGKITVPTVNGKIKIDIPQGLVSNAQLKVSGEGLPAFNNPEVRGDFYVELHTEMPRDLSAEEIDLIKRLRGMRKRG